MALRDFWTNVRTGARLLVPAAVADAPRLDAGAIERALRGATLWLTPRTVAGFNEADFPFLPEAERAKLALLVADFKQAASKVRPTAPASDAQVAEALPPFIEILRLLDFGRYGDADAYRIGKQIERLIEPDRPSDLVELRFHTGPDWTGDPGIWIWAILADLEDDQEFLARAAAIDPILSSASREVAPDLFPFVHFRSLSEQAELLQEGS